MSEKVSLMCVKYGGNPALIDPTHFAAVGQPVESTWLRRQLFGKETNPADDFNTRYLSDPSEPPKPTRAQQFFGSLGGFVKTLFK